MSCLKPATNPQGMQKATTLQFSFYQEAEGEDGEGGGLCKIHVPRLADRQASEHDLLRELVATHRVPKDLRWGFSILIHTPSVQKYSLWCPEGLWGGLVNSCGAPEHLRRAVLAFPHASVSFMHFLAHFPAKSQLQANFNMPSVSGSEGDPPACPLSSLQFLRSNAEMFRRECVIR